MNKPKRKSKEYLDYSACRNFLEEKYGYKERDYGGKWNYQDKIQKQITKKYGKSWWNKAPAEYNEYEKLASDEYNELLKIQPEYLDFWHWVCDNHEIHNGCYIIFSRECLESYNDVPEDDKYEMPKWVKEIYTHYLDEFEDEQGEVEMYVSW
jgi:hypothetical protein